jgi:hypothetical protein
MAKLGHTLQWAGFGLAAAAYLLIWVFRPHSGPIAGVVMGDHWKPSHLVLAFAAALVVAGLASLRWRWAGIALVLVAFPAAWYAISNHAMQWSHVVFLPVITYGPVVVVGVLLSVVGLAIRGATGMPRRKPGI